MWARIPDVFAEKTDEGTDARKKNDKVNARVREVFDLAGLQTINAFKSGTGVIVTFAYPADVDKAILERTISVDGKQYWVNRVWQIEIAYAFELVIGGTAGIDETAMQNIRSWFMSFEHDGQSLLVDARQAHGEPDYLIVSMTDWAATADVLKAMDRFRNEIENNYDLRAPQLLHRLNSTGAWKTDPSAAITEGAKKVTDAVDALTRRIETNEHKSCSPTSPSASDAENLECLLGNTPRIAPTDPYIPAPAPSAASASTTPPGIVALGPRSQPDDTKSNPSKRMRRTASHDDTSKAVSQLEPGAADEDTVMSAVHSLTHPPRSQLMAARSDTQAGVTITKPKPSLMHRYTKGPDGTRGFRSRKIMSVPCSVGTIRQPCLSDRLPLNVQIPSNAILFLAILVFFTSLVKVAAAATPFSMYALNVNGLVNSAKLHHINSAITTRNPHAFTLTESKTNTKTGPNLPNGDYNIFEELGVQADNHHLYKWGVALGIRMNIQITQRVQVTAAALRGRVVAVDIILQANDSSSFTYRVIGAYAPWDPGTPATRDFWPELTKLCQSTSTSWTLGGDLNATVSSSERSSGGIEARTQYLKFLDSVDGQDLWYNSPDRNL
ncbi:hypothetical protein B0H14DRAFT_3503274 [Mycena olivaceomarginata]|nr:hypothetical protein B0H14DRAFT_3503274 [Mycena olivaceomarginata]